MATIGEHTERKEAMSTQRRQDAQLVRDIARERFSKSDPARGHLEEIADKIQNTSNEYEVVQTVKIDPESLKPLVDAINGATSAIDRIPG